MDKKQLAKITQVLLAERERLLNNATQSRKRDLALSTDDLADEVDLASAERSQDVLFNIRGKEKVMLSAIDEALERIETNAYGQCEECSAPIPVKRLELFPTAKLCVQHQEEVERRKKNYVA